nr:BamA/TamA family outer membrane protein [Pseudoalteromonas xiamenensis]
MAYPFYALDTPYAYGFATSSNKRTESLYERGEVVHEFSQQTDLHQIYFGHSTTVAKNWTRRLLFGYQEDKERFTSLLASTRALPADRSARYPYIEYNWLENAYVKVRNVDSIFRTEDLQLGWNISAKLGYSDKGLSDDESRWLYWLFASKSHYVNDRSLVKFSALSQGAWKVDSSDAENQLLQLGLQYYYNDSATESWFANLEYQHIRKMTLDKQLTLGGETGLRGYPAHYLQGDSKWLLNLEKRYYWEYDLWQLFKVGGALFVDIGKTTGKPLFQPELGTLSDAGFGLRLAPSRANSNLMLHMDIAWPIQKDEKVDSMQWQFTVKNRF